MPLQVLFLAVKAGDVDGVKLLLEKGARTDIQFPPKVGPLGSPLPPPGRACGVGSEAEAQAAAGSS